MKSHLESKVTDAIRNARCESVASSSSIARVAIGVMAPEIERATFESVDQVEMYRQLLADEQNRHAATVANLILAEKTILRLVSEAKTSVSDSDYMLQSILDSGK